MGYTGNYKRPNSYVYGYSPNGKAMSFINLLSKGTDRNEIGTIYVYDTDSDDGAFDIDLSLEQVPTTNKFENFFFPCGKADDLITKSRKIEDNLYVYPNWN